MATTCCTKSSRSSRRGPGLATEHKMPYSFCQVLAKRVGHFSGVRSNTRAFCGAHNENAESATLTDVQVGVMGEGGERYLVVAGYVEAEFAEAEICAGLRPAVEDGPCVAVLDLMDDLGGAHANLECAKTFLLDFVGNDDLVRLVPLANDRAIEVIVIHLQEDVVLGIAVVEHPLQ